MKKFIPVFIKDEVLLYDVYINDTWYGSRRTLMQCERLVEAIMKYEHS